MNAKIKIFSLIVVLFALNLSADAQEEHLKNIITSGVSTPALDNGWGIHAGYNPVISWSNYLGVEGYAGYHYTQITGAFLSGENAQVHTLELYIGPRLYFTKKDKKIRPFINLLMGMQISLEKEENQEYNRNVAFGIAPGLFVNFNRFTAGVFLASPDTMGVRLGFEL